mgnify:CR=1 FL=1
MRAVAKLIAGEEVPGHVVVEPALLTQAELRETGVTTIEELAEKVPSFNHSDAAPIEWAPAD